MYSHKGFLRGRFFSAGDHQPHPWRSCVKRIEVECHPFLFPYLLLLPVRRLVSNQKQRDGGVGYRVVGWNPTSPDRAGNFSECWIHLHRTNTEVNRLHVPSVLVQDETRVLRYIGDTRNRTSRHRVPIIRHSSGSIRGSWRTSRILGACHQREASRLGRDRRGGISGRTVRVEVPMEKFRVKPGKTRSLRWWFQVLHVEHWVEPRVKFVLGPQTLPDSYPDSQSCRWRLHFWPFSPSRSRLYVPRFTVVDSGSVLTVTRPCTLWHG